MRTFVDDDTIADIAGLERLGAHVRFRDWTPKVAAMLTRYRGDDAWRGTWLDLYRPDVGDVTGTRDVLAAVFALLTDPEAPWQPWILDGHEFDLITITTKEHHARP